MKANLLPSLLVAALFALAVPHARADEEQDLIGVLQSGAAVPAKCTACQRLRVVGTTKCVPALAALLGEERTGHAARYALEGLPFPEAVIALREALGRTSGSIKAGLIDSLGWRQDTAAVPLLIPLLSGSDAMLAAAAASSLGRIGGKEATDALVAARDQAPPAVAAAVQEGLLRRADALRAAGDAAAAATLYRGLLAPAVPERIRVAAWRGVALADTASRTEWVLGALTSQERGIHLAALKVLREVDDAGLVKACLGRWASLPAEAQVAVLDAQVKLGGAEAAAILRTASQSPHPTVRIAAWQAAADLGDRELVAGLAQAAAGSDPNERDAARETLTRIRGDGVPEAFLKAIAAAEPLARAELLRALGERGDAAAAGPLLENASAPAEPVRLAALEALARLALPATLNPLLELAAKSKSDAEAEPVLKALYAVYQASPDKDQTGRTVLESLGRIPSAERGPVLPLLAELGTAPALETAFAAARDGSLELRKQAVRALAQWPNAAPAATLLELARSGGDAAFQVLAVRAAIQVAGLEPDLAQRLALLQQAKAAARRPEEKKQALGQIAQIPAPAALETAMADLAEPGLVEEAGLAAVAIGEKLAAGNPQLAAEVAARLLASCKSPEVVKRAWAMRGKPAPGAFLQDWLVCGPFRKAGVTGAIALFELPFGPERPGEPVEWKTMPPGDFINLAGRFPGEENCVAYLKTKVIAPADSEAALLLGSDDGIKAWLNGQVVHSNNVDRGDQADQDMAPIRLKQGANELLLKVTQGGGGWSAHARIVGPDGRPIPGLRTEKP